MPVPSPVLRTLLASRAALASALPPTDDPPRAVDQACCLALVDTLAETLAPDGPWRAEPRDALGQLAWDTLRSLGLSEPKVASSIEDLVHLPELLHTEVLTRHDGGWALVARPGHRKRAGAWYTPQALVDPTVRRTLAGTDGPVLDPAMGGGVWLLAALRHRVSRLGHTPTDAMATLHGLDVDPVAVAAARRALWCAAGRSDTDWLRLGHQLRQADVLRSIRWSAQSFDETKSETSFDWRAWLGADFPGFAAVVGNPPWEALRPDRRAWFSAAHPEYARLTRADAVRREAALAVENPALLAGWHAEEQAYTALRAHLRRAGFSHQGTGDPNAYKLFLELSWRVLRAGGSLGMVLPHALWTDLGSAPLRTLLRDRVRWMFGLENRERSFAIDSRFRFCVLIATRDAEPVSAQVAFHRTRVAEWAEEPPPTWAMPPDAQRVLSPEHGTLVEAGSRAELDLWMRLHTGAARLDTWPVRYATELHSTQAAHRLRPRDRAEAEAFVADPGGFWRHPDGRVRIPVYEGRMIGAFDPNQKAWQDGRGRRARWTPNGAPDAPLGPQYLLDANDTQGRHAVPRVAFMRVASATNERSMIATVLPARVASVDSVFHFLPTAGGLGTALALAGVFNSFVYDALLRARLGGNNLSAFVVGAVPVPAMSRCDALVPLVARLALTHPMFAPEWCMLRSHLPDGTGPYAGWATTPEDRRRVRAVVDALVALAYGINRRDLAHLLRAPTRDDPYPKGFWRSDRTSPPDQRPTMLALRAFDALLRHLDAGGTPELWAATAAPPGQAGPSDWERAERARDHIMAALPDVSQ